MVSTLNFSIINARGLRKLEATDARLDLRIRQIDANRCCTCKLLKYVHIIRVDSFIDLPMDLST